MPNVAVLSSSQTCAEPLRRAIELLEKSGVHCELARVSARFGPEELVRLLHSAEQSGAELVLTGEEPGEPIADFVCAHSPLPVLAVAPPGHAALEEAAQADLLSPGWSAVFQGRQAALAVLRILGLKHPECRKALEEHARKVAEELRRQNEQMHSRLSTARAAPPSTPPGCAANSGQAAQAAQESLSFEPSTPEARQRDLETLEEIARQFRPRLRTQWDAPPQLPRRKALDYSLSMREIISVARSIAAAYANETVQGEHLLAAVVDTPQCAAHNALRAAGVDFDLLAERLASLFPPVSPNAGDFFALDEQASALLQTAKEVARAAQRDCLVTTDLLQALFLIEDSPAAQALRQGGLTPATLSEVLHESSLPDEGAEFAASRPAPRAPEPTAELDPAEVARMEQRLSDAAHGAFAKEPPGVSVAQDDAPPPDQEQTLSPPDEEPASSDDAPESPQGEKPARVVACDAYNPSLDTVELASDLLLEGGVVAFPTDTVYGVAADASNAKAVSRLYEVKGRPATKAIAVLIHSTSLLKHLVRNVPEEVEGLLDEFWPGPLTVVFERHPAVFKALSSEPTLGVRIPDHYLALAVLSMVGRPLATTSANLSGQSDNVTAQQVAEHFGSRIDLILDGGIAPGGVTSTVLSVVEKPYRILRHGAIPKSEIERVLGMSVEG